MKTILKRALICLSVALLLFCIAAGFYLRDVSHADTVAQTALQSTDTVSVLNLDDDAYVFAPQHPDTGLIFYPGGKVEYTAYAPLMQQLAEQNILCILVKVPLNLAFFDMDVADDFVGLYPEIEHWYVGGHSLGGVAAANYVQEHDDLYDGILLAASYSNVDLSDLSLRAFSIYGDCDGVLNMEQLENNSTMLPDDTEYVVVDGGNHAQFGSYGPQEKDNPARISAKSQMQQTAQSFRRFVDDDR